MHVYLENYSYEELEAMGIEIEEEFGAEVGRMYIEENLSDEEINPEF